MAVGKVTSAKGTDCMKDANATISSKGGEVMNPLNSP